MTDAPIRDINRIKPEDGPPPPLKRILKMVQTGTVKDPVVERVVRRIVDDLHPTRIILFGSRARNEARSSSDIDLLLIYDGPLSKREVKLRVLDLFDLGDIPLDVFVLSSEEWIRLKPVANTLAREADETGIVCHG